MLREPEVPLAGMETRCKAMCRCNLYCALETGLCLSYYESIGQQENHDRTLKTLLSHDRYWPCLSYLTAWWDDASV